MTGKERKAAIVLQPRDEILLQLVSEFRLLSREQLQRLLNFPCITRINIRLKKLLDSGYLSRRFFPTLKGGPMGFYFLGPKGIDLLSGNGRIDSLLLRKERKDLLEQKDLFLNHHLSINEVRIALTLGIKDHPQMSLEQWLRENACPIEFPYRDGSSRKLRPDAYFCLSYQKRLYSFFVEMDLSTMSNSRMKSKAEAYLDYARSGLFEGQFGLKYFRVLVIAKTPERLFHLKRTVEVITDRVFLFSTQAQVCRGGILDRIWRRAGQERLLSILGD